MSDTSKPIIESTEAAYGMWADGQQRASAVINCETAEVLAANAGGRTALGVPQKARLPFPLDSAMPAIAALRQLSQHGPARSERQNLIFWRNGQLACLTCVIGFSAQDCAAHIAVQFVDAEKNVQSPEPDESEFEIEMPPVTNSFAANDDSPLRVIREDAETLKEIARRIRAGQSDLQTPVPLLTPVIVKEKQTNPDVIERVTAPPATSHTNWDNPREEPVPLQSREPAGGMSGEDLAKLAHELKTPLTAIAAAAEIMRDEQLGKMGNSKYLGYAADIHDTASHALDVIKNMLSAGVSAQRESFGLDAVDLNDIAIRTVSALQPLAAQRQLTLDFDADRGIGPILGNPTAVRQILLNLLTNALKFTPRGGDVRVLTGFHTDGSKFLAVRDTGHGMTDAEIASVFDDSRSMYQLRPGGGNGFGLYLVRRLAAENGAEIDIDSAPGKGTVVLVSFARDVAGVW